jgi:ATP-dependent Lhr-like helicase
VTAEPATSVFGPATRDWFDANFREATAPQRLGWPVIASGKHTLILAPTGSGKTLAAFLSALDRLFTQHSALSTQHSHRCRVLYVSPLKALSYDVERNLRAPLAGITIAARRLGIAVPDIRVAVRTGDTPQSDRRDILKDPPDILITTPESLYLMLTTQSARILAGVKTVIVDEIHTMAGGKRGAHLALSLERLERLTERPPQRIGLSATQRPLEEIARYLGGDRPVEIVDAGRRKELDIEVIVPVEDMSRLGELIPVNESPGGPAAGPEARTSIWPSVHPRLLELIREHRSTLIFCNNRRLTERLSQRVNELAGEDLVRAHHGSLAREQRMIIEDQLKAGKLPALVATSSLELGIDMGAVDLVVQVESPKSVARGLQRIGRAGHQVDAPSKGRIFPKFRGDLLETAVVVKRMREGAIEETKVPRNPLDVLAQQIVAMCVVETLAVDDILTTLRRAYSFQSLTREGLENVLGMLAGQYPSDEFAELRPRVIWDRVADTVSARRDARLVALTNAGTIPDRGLFGVFLGEGGPRVGELDEEMVFESRAGETFLLGATTWRIEQITRDQVIVSPAPGEPGKMPFWKGDGLGRPAELGKAIGAFTREISRLPEQEGIARLKQEHALDDFAAGNLLAYLQEQKEATGTLPTDRAITVERFRDELGDWRLCILTPFGARVHTPWALVLEAKIRAAGREVQALWGDDGIVVRLPETDEPPPEDLIQVEPEEVEDLLVNQLGGAAVFASHFRENAARALLLPRRRPGARQPLWQQRQRAADLMAVASRYGSFPVILETYRECLQDVFDLPSLVELLSGIRRKEIRLQFVDTETASPFARSLLFDYIAAFMYEGDMPLAERRAQALALDRGLLRELLGQEELRDLLDPEALAELEAELQSLADGRRIRSADGLHDLLRRLGDLTELEIAARVEGSRDDLAVWLRELEGDRRAAAVRIAGDERWIAAEDAGRYRDALGVTSPQGVPEAFLSEQLGPLEALLARWARSHGPFLEQEPAARWGLPVSLVREELQRMEQKGLVLLGEFRPEGVRREWCDPNVMRMLRRRSLGRLRKEIEPVEPETLGRFLPAWQGVGSQAGGLRRLHEAVLQLEGAPLPASVLERDILPARVADYRYRLLDELGAAGELLWAGRRSLGRDDGEVCLFLREHAALLLPAAREIEDETDLHRQIREHLRSRGASFFRDIGAACGVLYKGGYPSSSLWRDLKPEATGPSEADVLDALWDLVWAGEVTNDTFSPLRALAFPARSRAASIQPRSSGRWSLVETLREEAAPTAVAHGRAIGLLERYGVVTKEAALSEEAPGGFAAIYPLYKAMEEAGKLRRGHFIAGMGGAQFALPGAVDRLRAAREPDEARTAVLLAATDPANPYGAIVPWPKLGQKRSPLQRTAGAYVVLVDGRLTAYLDRSHRGVWLPDLVAGDEPAEFVEPDVVERNAVAALGALRAIVDEGRARRLKIESLNGEPIEDSPRAGLLEEAGFQRWYGHYSYNRPAGDTRRSASARTA